MAKTNMIRVRIWIARLAIWVCGLGITALLIALAQATHLAIQARAVRDGVNLWSTLGRSFLGIGGDLASANASLEVVAAFAAGIGGLIPIVLGTIIEIRNGQVKRLGPFAEERLGSGRRANRKAERIMRKYYTGATKVIVFSNTFSWIAEPRMWKVIKNLCENKIIMLMHPDDDSFSEKLVQALKGAHVANEKDIESVKNQLSKSKMQNLHLSYIEQRGESINPDQMILYRYEQRDALSSHWRLVTIRNSQSTHEFFNVLERFVASETNPTESS